MSAKTEHKSINATADGDNTLVPGVAGGKIKVLAYVMTVTAAANPVIFKSGAAGTEHARFSLPANGGVVAPGDGVNTLFECDSGAGLVSNNPTGVDVLGHLTYIVENG
jgi:hypothetical protein